MGFDFGIFWSLNFCEIKVFAWIFCMILFSLGRLKYNIVFLENTNNVKKEKKKLAKNIAANF